MCLHHVTSEVTLEELRSGGRAEVVVAAVLQALYTQDEEVLQPVLLSLPDVLAIISPPPAKTKPPRHESRYVQFTKWPCITPTMQFVMSSHCYLLRFT